MKTIAAWLPAFAALAGAFAACGLSVAPESGPTGGGGSISQTGNGGHTGATVSNSSSGGSSASSSGSQVGSGGSGAATSNGGGGSAETGGGGQLNGTKCTASTVCHSGNCVMGICCDEACTTGCMSCAMSDTGAPDGQCANVTMGKKDPQATCVGGDTCNGKGHCFCSDGVKDNGESDVDCGPNGTHCPACADGKQCGGNGDCVDGACGCAGTSCKTKVCCPSSCTGPCQVCGTFDSMLQCEPQEVGEQGGCDPMHACGPEQMCENGRPTGAMCMMNGDCFSNHCDSGMCRSTKQLIGFPCSNSSDCTTGVCLDGLCE